MDRPLPWLRYTPADELINQHVPIKDLKVTNPEGEDLGTVDGAILDVQSRRPYYLVIDAGGWFRSRYFLAPIGLTYLSDDETTVVLNLPKARIERFPGFNKSEFERFSAKDLETMSTQICAVSIGEESTEIWIGTEWERPDYTTPDWWSSVPSRPDRMGERALTSQARLPKDTSPNRR